MNYCENLYYKAFAMNDLKNSVRNVSLFKMILTKISNYLYLLYELFRSTKLAIFCEKI